MCMTQRAPNCVIVLSVPVMVSAALCLHFYHFTFAISLGIVCAVSSICECWLYCAICTKNKKQQQQKYQIFSVSPCVLVCVCSQRNRFDFVLFVCPFIVCLHLLAREKKTHEDRWEWLLSRVLFGFLFWVLFFSYCCCCCCKQLGISKMHILIVHSIEIGHHMGFCVLSLCTVCSVLNCVLQSYIVTPWSVYFQFCHNHHPKIII